MANHIRPLLKSLAALSGRESRLPLFSTETNALSKDGRKNEPGLKKVRTRSTPDDMADMEMRVKRQVAKFEEKLKSGAFPNHCDPPAKNGNVGKKSLKPEKAGQRNFINLQNWAAFTKIRGRFRNPFSMEVII